MPKDNFTNLGLGSNEMFSVSHGSTFSLLYRYMSSLINQKRFFIKIILLCKQ